MEKVTAYSLLFSAFAMAGFPLVLNEIYPTEYTLKMRQETALTAKTAAVRRNLSREKAEGYNREATHYTVKGDMKKARSVLEQAIGEFPEHAKSYMNHGQVCYALDDFPAAKKSLQKFLDSPYAPSVDSDEKKRWEKGVSDVNYVLANISAIEYKKGKNKLKKKEEINYLLKSYFIKPDINVLQRIVSVKNVLGLDSSKLNVEIIFALGEINMKMKETKLPYSASDILNHIEGIEDWAVFKLTQYLQERKY